MSKKEDAVNYTKYNIRSHETCTGFNIINKNEAGFIERFGKLNRRAEPGLNVTIPIIESIRKITLREISVFINPQASVTKDNVQVTTAGAVYFRVNDPEKACYETHDLLFSIVTHAQSSMRSAVGQMELDRLFHDRAFINNIILETIQPAALKWGIDILRYEITDVTPDPNVSKAMDSQSIAERKRRETALNADAQRQHDITVSEGKREAMVNDAEGTKRKMVLGAEAKAESDVLNAKAKAESDVLNAKAKAESDVLNAKAKAESNIVNAESIAKSTIIEANAKAESNIIIAKSEAESMVIKAEAEAIAIAKISESLHNHSNTMNYLLAKDYMRNVAKMLPKSTVFIPNDIGDISKLVASATSINNHLAQ